MKNSKTAIVVHAGAGAWDLKQDLAALAKAACDEVAEQAINILQKGASALDAVELAVKFLEDCPSANAGHGATLTTEGTAELDAAIMSGENLAVGAVASVKKIKNPIELARLVMEQSPHCLLVGEGAERFAVSHKIKLCSPNELITESQLESFNSWLREQKPPTPVTSDTVGAVALDLAGNLAVASSTGGTARKLPGRVGDSPLVGCGFYANSQSAVTATGKGEFLMRLVISKHASDLISSGSSPQQACDEAIKLLANFSSAAEGGLISLNSVGEVGVSFNTFDMPHAVKIAGSKQN